MCNIFSYEKFSRYPLGNFRTVSIVEGGGVLQPSAICQTARPISDPKLDHVWDASKYISKYFVISSQIRVIKFHEVKRGQNIKVGFWWCDKCF